MPTRREFLVQSAVAGVVASERTKSGDAPPSDRAIGAPDHGHYQIPNTELTVSRLAYGVSLWGKGWNSADYVPASVRAVRTAYENGITFFDTADVYAGGLAEMALGRFLSETPGLRNRVVIQTKCGGDYIRVSPGDQIKLDSRGSSFGPELDRKRIVLAVEGSLKRLGTDRLDILLLHICHPLTQPEEVAEAFDNLKDSGKVRYFGVSNYSAMQIALLKKHVRQPLVVSQNWLGLANCKLLAESASLGGLIDHCRINNISIQAYSPLKGGSVLNSPTLLNPSPDSPPEVKQVAQLLQEISQHHKANPSAIMLAWLLRHPAHIIPILGASNPNHIIENCLANGVSLTHEEWSVLWHAAMKIQNA
ncbi:aldo/keto reductase [Steroidobacter cummioxidans]|uniref:aldo/keto reductase n=1 Tax=Steroidobacter cummioxidans TaxID=1803913 RepID=UPI000E3198A1|nr:aldo/keto reductase [Steroidobacter cummioxidans]